MGIVVLTGTQWKKGINEDKRQILVNEEVKTD